MGYSDGDMVGSSLRPTKSLPSSATCSPPSSPGQFSTHSRLVWSQQLGQGICSNLANPAESSLPEYAGAGSVAASATPVLIDHRVVDDKTVAARTAHASSTSTIPPLPTSAAERAEMQRLAGHHGQHCVERESGVVGGHASFIVDGGATVGSAIALAPKARSPITSPQKYVAPLAQSLEVGDDHSSECYSLVQPSALHCAQPLLQIPQRMPQDMPQLSGSPGGSVPYLDGEVVQYARMLSQQAHQASAFDQKVTALSRRVASELRKAEREREEHAQRIETLEVFRMQQIGGSEAQLCQVHNVAVSEVERVAHKLRLRLDRELAQMSEQLENVRLEAEESRDKISSKLQKVSKRIDAEDEALDALRAYRKEAEAAMARSREDSSTAMDALAAARRTEDDWLEEKLETAMTRERKQGHERLRSSCAELTGNLNKLRTELVQQHVEVKQVGSQVSELGSELASRLQAKIAAATQTMSDQANGVRLELQAALDVLKERATASEVSLEQVFRHFQAWRQDVSEFHSSRVDFHDLLRRECEKTMEVSKDDVHIVHLEVMSVNTRVAAVEEYLADRRSDFGRNDVRKCNALLLLQQDRGESVGSKGNYHMVNRDASPDDLHLGKVSQFDVNASPEVKGIAATPLVPPLLSPASESRALQRAVDRWDFPPPCPSPGAPGSPGGARRSRR